MTAIELKQQVKQDHVLLMKCMSGVKVKLTADELKALFTSAGWWLRTYGSEVENLRDIAIYFNTYRLHERLKARLQKYIAKDKQVTFSFTPSECDTLNELESDVNFNPELIFEGSVLLKVLGIADQYYK